MPLGFVLVQQLPDLSSEGPVQRRQADGQVLVYGGFGNAKGFGGSADGCPVFNDVHSQIAGPLLYALSHLHHSPMRA